MKLLSLKLKGIGRFHGETVFPVEQLDGAEVVALVGLNGAGKTTMAEALPAVLYGDVPSHGALARFANAADSYIEAAIGTDQAYMLTRKINAVRKTPKTEAYITDAEGNPLNDSGNVGPFDAEVAKRFPSEKVFLASGFAAQRRNGQFLEIARADRKALFVEMLGLGHLQTLSDAAGKRAREVETQLLSDRARISTLRAQAEAKDPETGQPPETALRAAETRLANATTSLVEAELRAKEAKAGHDKWARQCQELEKATIRAESAHREAGQRRSAMAESLRGQERQLTQISVKQAQLADRLSSADVFHQQVFDGDDAKKEIVAVEKCADSAREAQVAYSMARSEWQERRSAADNAWQAHAEAWDTANALGDVPCDGAGKYSVCPLISRATQAKQEEPQLKKRLQLARDAVGDEPTPPEPVDLSELDAELRSLRGTVATAAAAQAKLETLDDAKREIATLDDEAGEIRTQIAAGRDALGQANKELGWAVEAVDNKRDAEREHAAVEPEAPGVGAVEQARAHEIRCVTKVARAAEFLEAAEKALAECQKLEDASAGATADLDDWRHLQKGMGRDGAQALEIDAAGPEISDLINSLLAGCYGSRFACRLTTTEMRADGKGTKEDFDLHVIDSVEGWEGSAGGLSGGERVFVAEALSLAMAIYHAGKSSIPIMDLWRDECCGALDYEKAPLYVAMLRKALRLGGFQRVYFVAHQRELWALADVQLLVEDGQCRVVDGVSREAPGDAR